MIIQALRYGNADIAFLEGGPAWIGWQEYDLSVLAVETTTSAGATHYNASAWVLNGSDIAEAHLDGDDSTDPFTLLEGKTSCLHRLVKVSRNADAYGLFDHEWLCYTSR